MNSFLEQFDACKSLYLHLTAPVCAAYGLSQMEFNVLLFLANNPQYNTAADVVRMRHLAKSYVSTSVQALLARGLLHAERSSADRRAIHLSVTALAKEIVEAGRSAQQQFGQTLFVGISAEEQEAFFATLQAIHANAQAYSAESSRTGV